MRLGTDARFFECPYDAAQCDSQVGDANRFHNDEYDTPKDLLSSGVLLMGLEWSDVEIGNVAVATTQLQWQAQP